MFLGTLVALARTEMWSQPPYNQKAMSLRAYIFHQRLFHKPPHRRCDRTVPDCHCTHTNAVVPALSLGLPRLDTHATTHRPPAQAMAPLDFVGNYPDLEQTLVGAPGPAAEGQLDGQGRDQRGNPFFPQPSNLISSTSPGPVAPQTLCEHCWTHDPSWSPAGSWG